MPLFVLGYYWLRGGKVHLQKPAVVTFRVTYALKAYLEELAVRSGLSFSDFMRVSILVGAKRQAEIFGVTDVEVPILLDPNVSRGPAYKKGKYQQLWESREFRPVSDGSIPENVEELVRQHMDGVLTRTSK